MRRTRGKDPSDRDVEQMLYYVCFHCFVLVSHLLSALLLFLVLVTLVTQLVCHLPARFRFVFQPVGQSFCLILQLSLLLVMKATKQTKRGILKVFKSEKINEQEKD